MGIRKWKAKCVWGVPDPGFTVTRVVGPSTAAVADAAIAVARSAVASAARILHRAVTSRLIMADATPARSPRDRPAA
jgi:hypothetical protein